MFSLFHWARLIRKPALWSSSFPVTWLLVQCCFLVSWLWVSAAPRLCFALGHFPACQQSSAACVPPQG